LGRKLGQHFLTDPRVLDRIAESIDPNPEDTVLEIGTGRGTLTRRLAKRVRRVISIERDPILIKGLKRSDLNQNITIVEIRENQHIRPSFHRAPRGLTVNDSRNQSSIAL